MPVGQSAIFTSLSSDIIIIIMHVNLEKETVILINASTYVVDKLNRKLIIYYTIHVYKDNIINLRSLCNIVEMSAGSFSDWFYKTDT